MRSLEEGLSDVQCGHGERPVVNLKKEKKNKARDQSWKVVVEDSNHEDLEILRRQNIGN